MVKITGITGLSLSQSGEPAKEARNSSDRVQDYTIMRKIFVVWNFNYSSFKKCLFVKRN